MHKKQGFALPSRTPAGKTLPDIQENKVMAATGAEKSLNPAENSALAARLAREITGDQGHKASRSPRPQGPQCPRANDPSAGTVSVPYQGDGPGPVAKQANSGVGVFSLPRRTYGARCAQTRPSPLSQDAVAVIALRGQGYGAPEGHESFAIVLARFVVHHRGTPVRQSAAPLHIMDGVTNRKKKRNRQR
jgi:hypothetical protein